MFFRASARQRAQELGVTGHARNLADGRVEVLACGPRKPSTRCANGCRHGPPAASVTSVDIESVPADSVAPWPGAFRTD